MITHQTIWAAIDGIAERYTLSPSGLARAAGLDATTFNKSKRFTASGRERWPNTESIAKVLEATGADFDEFVKLMMKASPQSDLFGRSIPLLDMDLAGSPDYFNGQGEPISDEWDEIIFPEVSDDHTFALEVVVDDYEPVYWAGDILIISPQAEVRRGDRVVVKLIDGEVVAKQLIRKTAKRIELAPLQTSEPDQFIDLKDIEWMFRIVWVRQ